LADLVFCIAQHGFEDFIAIMGHEATTMGKPTLKRQNKTAKTRPINRYLNI